jgi:hypothetical protein
MKGDVLRDTLFLRANWRVMELLKGRALNRALAAANEIEAAGIGGGGTARPQPKRARNHDSARCAVAAVMGAGGAARGADVGMGALAVGGASVPGGASGDDSSSEAELSDGAAI